MKRLIKKSEQINKEMYIPVNELDEADIKFNRCPLCKFRELQKNDGFKYCPRCGNKFKVFNGDGYIVVK